jgi:O-antigen/teichoic acid export membrane protein
MELSKTVLTARLSMRANFSWTFLGNIIYVGSQWGMLVALAKLGTPDMVGQFALGFAVTAPVMMFASLKIRIIQATDAKGDYRFGEYLSLRIITTLLAVFIIVAFVTVIDYNLPAKLIIIAVGIAKAIESISDVFYGLLQRYERMDRIAVSLMLKGPLSLAAFSLGLYYTGSVLIGTLCLMATWALVLSAYDIRAGLWILRSNFNDEVIGTALNQVNVFRLLEWNTNRLINLALLAAPLGFYVLINSLITNIPRFILERYHGEYLLGIFVALASFERAGSLTVHALGESASPRLSQYFAANKIRSFRILLIKLTGMGAFIGLAGVIVTFIAGKEVLTILYQPEYAQTEVFLWLMVAAGMDYTSSLMYYGLTASRNFRVQMILSLVIALTLTSFCFYLIPTKGLIGAAMALVYTRIIEVICIFVITQAITLKSRGIQKQPVLT